MRLFALCGQTTHTLSVIANKKTNMSKKVMIQFPDDRNRDIYGMYFGKIEKIGLYNEDEKLINAHAESNSS